MTRGGKTILFCTVLLAAFGVSEQIRLSDGAAAGLSGPLAAGVLSGAAAFFAMRARGGDAFRRIAPFAPFAALAAAVALKMFGRAYRGGVFLPGGVNPMEAVKPLAAIFAAEFLAASGEAEEGEKRALHLKFCGGMALFAASAALLNDFGLLATIALSVLCTVFAHSVFAGTLSALAACGACALFFAFPPAHVARRMTAWLDPFSDPAGAGWQILKAQEVMIAGGVFGADFGSAARAAAYVPVASSDFVYAVAAGEWGLAGCGAIFAIYLIMAFCGLSAASRAEDERSRLAAAATVSFICVQALLNAGGVVRAIPMTGLTLPLVSRGGSSLATTLFMCGALAGLASRERSSSSSPAGRRRRGRRLRF